ncbi:MAG: hypothetical protein JWN30_2714 [Bacilli bacterium]|nr:hypothetical protein [Bacilli bacterium]
MTEKNLFVRGAMLLAIAGVISKILGSIYTIFLQNMIGDQGLGLYQMAYPIYSTLLILSTAGFPIAVSKFVSEHIALGDYRGAKTVFRISSVLLTVSGVICFVILFFCAPWFAGLFGDASSQLAIQAIAPALLVVPVMSAIRGYFQGWQQMEPTAVSQVFEQLVRVGTILIAAALLFPYGAHVAAAGAAFGAVTGGLVSLLILLVYMRKSSIYFRHDVRMKNTVPQPNKWVIMRKLIYYAIPVSLGALVVPLMNNIDVISVVNILKQTGMSQAAATEAFGLLSGRAFKLMLLPTTFATAIGAALMPAISAALAVGNQGEVRSKMDLSMRFTVLISLPAALGLAILAGPIDTMLFKNDQGSQAILIISLATLFSSVQLTTSAILQGINSVYVPVRNLFIGCFLKLLLNYLLVPAWGINGAAFATVSAYFLSALLNLWEVYRTTGVVFSMKALVWRPLFAALVMSVLAYTVNRECFPWAAAHLHSLRFAYAFSVLASISIGTLVYTISLLITGSITSRDLESVPRIGISLAKLFNRIGILR